MFATNKGDSAQGFNVSPWYATAGQKHWDEETAFLLAVKDNQTAVLERLLETKYVDVDHKFAPKDSPAVCLAVEAGHREILSCLIRHGCSVNQSDRWGDTALHRAVYCRRVDLVRILLNERANINILNKNGVNVVHLAVQFRALEVLRELLNPSAATSIDNLTKVLHSKDSHGFTPLLLACACGYDEIVLYLLNLTKENFVAMLNQRQKTHRRADASRQYFAECHKERTQGSGPFHFALRLDVRTVCALSDELPCASKLINSQNQFGSSPLHSLAQAERSLQNKSAELAKILLNNGACPDLREIYGKTPLHEAIVHDNVPVFEALLRAGCRTDIKDRAGHTPLWKVVLRRSTNRSSFIELLLAFGVDLNREPHLFTRDDEQELEEDEDRVNTDEQLLIILRQLRRSNELFSLKRTCRNVIRKNLKSRADDAIKSFDFLPEKLKTFLLVENESEVLLFS